MRAGGAGILLVVPEIDRWPVEKLEAFREFTRLSHLSLPLGKQ